MTESIGGNIFVPIATKQLASGRDVDGSGNTHADYADDVDDDNGGDDDDDDDDDDDHNDDDDHYHDHDDHAHDHDHDNYNDLDYEDDAYL